MKWCKVVLAFVAVAFAKANPQLSESFEAKGNVWYSVGSDVATGYGSWVVDQVDGMSSEKWTFDGAHQIENVDHVRRYDLGVEYNILSSNKYGKIDQDCHAKSVSGAMPSQWAWLYFAEDHGVQDNVGPAKQTCRLFTYTVAGSNLAVCLDDNSNVPVYYSRNFRAGKLEVQFTHYVEDEADNRNFEVNSLCNKFDHLIKIGDQEATPVVSYDLLKYNAPQALAQALAKAKEICTCGCPYIWGGNGPCCGGGSSGYDCSGLVTKAYKVGGLNIARTASQQQKGGKACSGGLKAGDLIFFGNPAHHVVMYAGNNKIYECPRTGLNCRITNHRSYDGGCKRYF